MDLRFTNLKSVLIAASIAASAACMQAQSFVRPGQAIIFSAPDDSDAASNAPPLVPQAPSALDFGGAKREQDFDFQNSAAVSSPLPPPPVPIISPAEAERRKSWGLMTPSEIFGVVPSKQASKSSERDAMGLLKKPTAVERYYERQTIMQTNGGLFPDAPFLRRSFPDNADNRVSAAVFNPVDNGFGNSMQPTAPFQKPGVIEPPDKANAGFDAGWPKNLNPVSTSAQTVAQETDMVEFRKLLDSSSQPRSDTKSFVPPTGGGIFSAKRSPALPSFGQPLNPAPSPFGMLNTGISSLPAYPGAEQTTDPTTVPVPDWKPQPPPWMLKGPQPGVVPQRKF